MEENEHCYHYEDLCFSEPLFRTEIDVTYVIHLEGNGRYESAIQQLEQYPITERVHILHNRGFKKCEKNPHIRSPPYDLTDAFLQIFKHAYENKYENILILEDDFIFDEKIRSDFHRKNIVEFLQKRDSESFLYYLGCVPALLIPYDSYHYRAGYTCGMHSVIYSKKYREAIMNYEQVDINDWDLFNNICFRGSRYVYYTPLCYQLIPVTENSKSWGDFNDWGHFNVLTRFVGSLFFSILQLFGMDTSVEPGYSFFYLFSKLLFFILVFLVSFLLYAWVGRGFFSKRFTRSKSGK
jgi:hypothetical protein